MNLGKYDRDSIAYAADQDATENAIADAKVSLAENTLDELFGIDGVEDYAAHELDNFIVTLRNAYNWKVMQRARLKLVASKEKSHA